MSVSVDTLHLGTLHHFSVGAGNPNLRIFEPAPTGGIDGDFARVVIVAEQAAAMSKMDLPDTDHHTDQLRVPSCRRSADGAALPPVGRIMLRDGSSTAATCYDRRLGGSVR
jgi:hypothetical protein